MQRVRPHQSNLIEDNIFVRQQRLLSSASAPAAEAEALSQSEKVANTILDQHQQEEEQDNTTKTTPIVVKVAILGPPNAGKSTLYNRLLDKRLNKSFRLSSDKHKKSGQRKKMRGRFAARSVETSHNYRGGTAIVTDVPGTTRDRRQGIGRIAGTYFQLVDTAGVDGERLDHYWDKRGTRGKRTPPEEHAQFHKKKPRHNAPPDKVAAELTMTTPKEILRPMMQQALEAAQEAHLILFMYDAKIGVTSDFHETCRWLRKHGTRPRPPPATAQRRQVMEGGGVMQNANHDNQEDLPPPPRQRVLVLANKLEGQNWDFEDSPVHVHLDEATRAGFGEPVCISALHGEGMADILLVIHELQREWKRYYRAVEQINNPNNGNEDDDYFPFDDDDDMKKEEEDAAMALLEASGKEKPLQLAILGRVNVGKSTLVNSLLQQERVITGATPGLTRDAILIEWSWQGRPIQLVDTAGLRKPSKRTDNVIEDMAVMDAMRAMKVADVAVLVLDAGALYLQRHELAICETVLKEGRALVVAANKMDLICDYEYTATDFEAGVRQQLEERFPMLRHTPIVALSGLTGEHVHELMPVVLDARDRWARTIPTAKLNHWLQEVLDEHEPPLQPTTRRPTRIKYMVQTKGRPPTFLLFCNTSELPDAYLRYLTRQFQESFDFYGMDVRLVVRLSAPENPYDPNKNKNNKRRRDTMLLSGVGGRERRFKRAMERLKQTGTSNKRRARSIQIKRARGYSNNKRS